MIPAELDAQYLRVLDMYMEMNPHLEIEQVCGYVWHSNEYFNDSERLLCYMELSNKATPYEFLELCKNEHTQDTSIVFLYDGKYIYYHTHEWSQ